MPDAPMDGPPDGSPASHRHAARRERAAVLARILAIMEFWHITPDELEHAVQPLRPPAAPPVIKYRHPVSGLTWDGQGEHPQWLRDALLKEGFRVDELKPGHQATP